MDYSRDPRDMKGKSRKPARRGPSKSVKTKKPKSSGVDAVDIVRGAAKLVSNPLSFLTMGGGKKSSSRAAAIQSVPKRKSGGSSPRPPSPRVYGPAVPRPSRPSGARPMPRGPKKPAPGSRTPMPRRPGQKPAKPVEMPKRRVPATKPGYKVIGGKKVGAAVLKKQRKK